MERRDGRGVWRCLAAGAVLAAPAAGSAATAPSGHGGWRWSNPTPTGESLRSVVFRGPTGFAVGVDGTVIRSDDGGVTWRGLAPGTVGELTSVALAGPAGFVAASACGAFASADGSRVTGRVVFPGASGCGTPVRAAAFTDAGHGELLGGNGAIVHTADGGATFARRASLPGSPAARGTAAPAALVRAPDGALLGLVGGDVVRSTDHAATWTLVGRAAAPLTDIAFGSATQAYAVGSGQLLGSADGGQTWSVLPASGALAGARAVACADAATCLFAFASSPRVARTADGGATVAEAVPTGGVVADVAFATAARAVAVGSDGLVATSDDGGVTWTNRLAGGTVALTGLSASRRALVAYGPNGAVVRSVDGGGTWAQVWAPTTAHIVGAAFPGTGLGYAADASGGVFVTTNGGVSWRRVPGGIGTRLSGLAATPSGTAFVWTDSAMRRARRGGRFARVPLPFTRARVLSVQVAGGRVFLATTGAVWRSDSGGHRWRRMALPAGASGVRGVSCPARPVCWLVTGSRRVYVTRSAGRDWASATAAVGRPHDGSLIAGVAAQSARVAVVSTTSGRVRATRDAGRTFVPQRVSPAELSALAVAPGRIAALDGRGDVFVTTRAGHAGRPTRLVLRAPARAGAGGRLLLRGAIRPARRAVVAVTAGDGMTYLVATDARGRFARRVRISGTTTFVAQWEGDAAQDGAATRVVTVRPAR